MGGTTKGTVAYVKEDRIGVALEILPVEKERENCDFS